MSVKQQFVFIDTINSLCLVSVDTMQSRLTAGELHSSSMRGTMLTATPLKSSKSSRLSTTRVFASADGKTIASIDYNLFFFSCINQSIHHHHVNTPTHPFPPQFPLLQSR